MQLSNISKYGFIILSIVTLGIFNLFYFLFYGVNEFFYKKVAKYYKEQEKDSINMSLFGQLSLLSLTILTLGLVWLFIVLAYGFYELFMLNHTEDGKKLTSKALLSIAITSILTFGLVWIAFLMRYWYSELISNKIHRNFANKEFSTGLGTISLLIYTTFALSMTAIVSYYLTYNPEIYEKYISLNLDVVTNNNIYLIFTYIFLTIISTLILVRVIVLLISLIIKERMIYKSSLGKCWLYKTDVEVFFHENVIIN